MIMKRVYLDWGVVSYLKRDEYAELRNLLLSNKGRLFFVYSPAHFEDLTLPFASLQNPMKELMMDYNNKSN